jgi:hypothetical protein
VDVAKRAGRFTAKMPELLRMVISRSLLENVKTLSTLRVVAVPEVLFDH